LHKSPSQQQDSMRTAHSLSKCGQKLEKVEVYLAYVILLYSFIVLNIEDDMASTAEVSLNDKQT
jgi:hypothetical protein